MPSCACICTTSGILVDAAIMVLAPPDSCVYHSCHTRHSSDIIVVSFEKDRHGLISEPAVRGLGEAPHVCHEQVQMLSSFRAPPRK